MIYFLYQFFLKRVTNCKIHSERFFYFPSETKIEIKINLSAALLNVAIANLIHTLIRIVMVLNYTNLALESKK